LFNGMGYTYDEALQKAHNVLSEAKKTNNMNKDVQNQVDTLILESGTSDAEVLQARGDYSVLRERLDEEFDFITDYNRFPQSPRPQKQGMMTNSTKLLRKTGASSFELYQKANKGYLRYTFNTIGGGNDPSDA